MTDPRLERLLKLRVTGFMMRLQNYLLGDTPDESYYKDRILVGHKNLASMNNIGTPCVVLVAGSGSAKEGPESPGLNANPRVLRSGELILEAHCWGKDYEEAELLEAAVLSACFRAIGPRAYIDGEDWSEGANMTAGELLIGTFHCTGFLIPQIKLPLTNPIQEAVGPEITVTGPASVTDPTSLSDVPLSLPVRIP